MTEPSLAFVRGVGFRESSGALQMRGEAVATQGERTLTVTKLVSSVSGTELTFRIRDAVPRLDESVMRRMMGDGARLRDSTGHVYELDRCARSSSSCGFDGLTRSVMLERVPAHLHQVVLEVDGSQGEWSLPIDLIPFDSGDATAAQPLALAQEHGGVTVTLVSAAFGPEQSSVDLEVSTTLPVARVHGIGSQYGVRLEEALLFFVDEQGRRFDEISQLPGDFVRDHDARSEVAVFPALPEDARELTLTVPKVIIEEEDGRADIEMAGGSQAAALGPYPIRVTPSWSDASSDRHFALRDRPTITLDVDFGDWRDDRLLLVPGEIRVDGAAVGYYATPNRAGVRPQATGIESAVANANAAKVVTLLRPVVEVRGPWTFRFRRTS